MKKDLRSIWLTNGKKSSPKKLKFFGFKITRQKFPLFTIKNCKPFPLRHKLADFKWGRDDAKLKDTLEEFFPTERQKSELHYHLELMEHMSLSSNKDLDIFFDIIHGKRKLRKRHLYKASCMSLKIEILYKIHKNISGNELINCLDHIIDKIYLLKEIDLLKRFLNYCHAHLWEHGLYHFYDSKIREREKTINKPSMRFICEN